MIPVLYAFITSLATIIGGLLPNLKFFKKIDFRYLVSFAAGAMISIALFDILPELDSSAMSWVAIGFFGIYLIEKFAILHTCTEKECEYHSLGWPAMIGVGAESLVDGIAIAIGYAVNPTLGILIAVAVIAHELPRGFTTYIIMKNAGKSITVIWGALLIDAGFTPIGAVIGIFLPITYFGPMLGFIAGTFLYVGATDMLPESHKKFNLKVVLSLLSGVALIYLITRFIHL